MVETNWAGCQTATCNVSNFIIQLSFFAQKSYGTTAISLKTNTYSIALPMQNTTACISLANNYTVMLYLLLYYALKQLVLRSPFWRMKVRTIHTAHVNM